MSVEFNKKLMFDNISLLLRETGKKIGELEADAGVSAGYISRTSKDNTTKPGIDFIVNVADSLKISIDTLLNVDLTGLTPTEKYLVSFIDKLKSDTEADKLDWLSESAGSLNRLTPDCNGEIYHPLFSYEEFNEEGESGYPEPISAVVFTSNSFDVHTAINDDCFSLNLKNGSTLYLMNICKAVRKINDSDAYAIEAWIYKPYKTSFLCSTKSDPAIEQLLKDLYDTIKTYSKHPKINKDIRNIIDAFMKDDLGSNDNYDEIPISDELPF